MTLNTDLTDYLDPILATFTDRLQARLNGWMATIYLRGSAQMIQWGRTKLTDRPIYYEGAPIQQAINYANKHCAKLVTEMNEETKKRLAEVIGNAIENKRGIPGLARDIRKEFDDMTKYRSELIARTESCDALEQAFMDRSNDLGITGKEWVTYDPCPICEENEAEGEVPIAHVFSSGHERPPAHPNCLLPDVRVESPLTVAASRAFYNGDAVKLTTENGHNLTITPNHMVLTPLGFVKAKFLHEGDYVIRSTNSKRITSSIDPYNDHSPAFISDIWDSLMVKQGMVRCSVPVTPHYFYGDAGAFDGNIDVVYPDSFLLGEVFGLFFSEHISKNKLYGADAYRSSLSRLRSQFSFGNSGMSALNGDMGCGNSSHSLCSGHSSHTGNVGLATIPRSYSGSEQSPADYTPVYTELSRQFQLRFAGLITGDKLVKVRNFDYSGHVYDLQSLEQLYIANSIIVKNCRCALAPVMLGKE